MSRIRLTQLLKDSNDAMSAKGMSIRVLNVSMMQTAIVTREGMLPVSPAGTAARLAAVRKRK